MVNPEEVKRERTKCIGCPHKLQCKPCETPMIEQLQAVRAIVNPNLTPNSDPTGRMKRAYDMMNILIQNWQNGRYSPVVHPDQTEIWDK